MEKENKYIAEEPQPDYEKAEMDLLGDALKRFYTERFQMMTLLMKRSIMFKKAKITHKPVK